MMPTDSTRPSSLQIIESSLEREMRARLALNVPLAILSIALNYFKPFTHEYGWVKADALLQFLQQVLHDALRTRGNADDALVHIAGDFFEILTTPDRAELIAQDAIRQFDAQVGDYYDETARQARYLDCIDRRGNPVRVPVATLTISILSNDKRPLEHPLQALHFAAEVWKHLRLQEKSCYAFDRRLK